MSHAQPEFLNSPPVPSLEIQLLNQPLTDPTAVNVKHRPLTGPEWQRPTPRVSNRPPLLNQPIRQEVDDDKTVREAQ